MNSNDENETLPNMAAATTTKSEVAEDDYSRKIFEEERKALLDGMAAKLTVVINRMSEINQRLKEHSKDSASVSTLSELWQQSYMISQEVRMNDDNSNNKHIRKDSSLFTRKNYNQS